MVTRKSIGLSVFIALVAMLAMALSASAASAACPNILCGPEGALRSDGTEPPEGGRYGADIMATNTAGALRLLAVGAPVANETPKGYAYFGVELERNPTSVAGCPEGHRFAQGHVTFADIQNSQPSAVYAGISPGGFGSWPFSVRSDECASGGGAVTIEQVHLFFPGLGNVTAVGTFTGQYVQPNVETCQGGGVELNISQPGVLINGALTAEVDNGAGKPALLCFVSSNNELFPEVAPEWTPLEGFIEKD